MIHYGKSLESSKEWSFKFFVDGRTHSRWIVRKTDRMWTLSKLYHREDDKIMEGKLAFSELVSSAALPMDTINFRSSADCDT